MRTFVLYDCARSAHLAETHRLEVASTSSALPLPNAYKDTSLSVVDDIEQIEVPTLTFVT